VRVHAARFHPDYESHPYVSFGGAFSGSAAWAKGDGAGRLAAFVGPVWRILHREVVCAFGICTEVPVGALS